MKRKKKKFSTGRKAVKSNQEALIRKFYHCQDKSGEHFDGIIQQMQRHIHIIRENSPVIREV
jgi:hypothetical protein